MYLGQDGFGRPRNERELYGQGRLILGLADRFSLAMSLTAAGDGRLANAETIPSIGFMVTPLSAGRFSADFMFDFAGEPGAGVLEIAPAIELNYDAAPEQASWGLYFRQGMYLAGATDEGGGSPDWWSTLGAYRKVAPGHQILLEFGAVRNHEPESRPEWQAERLALGYNAGLASNIELISEAQWLISPEDSVPHAAGVMVGVIATLPFGQ